MATIKPIHCSRCGAPLTVVPGQPIVTCGYCQQSHSVLAPPAVPATGTTYRVGDRVAVEWGGSWWPATIHAVRPGGGCRVHFEGWDSRWDEDVPPERVAPRHVAPPFPTAAASATAGAATLGWVVFAAVLVAALGGVLFVAVQQGRSQAIQQGSGQNGPNESCGDPNQIYANGDAVRIEWHGSWWAGRIIGVEGGGRYRITYDGYSSSWDETVGPDRLCPKPK